MPDIQLCALFHEQSKEYSTEFNNCAVNLRFNFVRLNNKCMLQFVVFCSIFISSALTSYTNDSDSSFPNLKMC